MGGKILGVNMSRLAMFHLLPARQVVFAGAFPNYRHKKVYSFFLGKKSEQMFSWLLCLDARWRHR